MTSKRATLIQYGVIVFFFVAAPTFMVTFPEAADRVFARLPFLIAAAGVYGVGAGLFLRDLPLVLIGAGFLVGIAGSYYSHHWLTPLGTALWFVGFMLHIKRHGSRPPVA